ncbi:microtubule-associated tumor suppressor candidate 2 isoform X1 [Anguilla anguilla]|uniref:microtubule-associated tumor suppressor candidate 2 isoform X1 n=1 Tax=Anguilla anguilla TaxID=7936 RepID=UPI0015AAAFB9|nr:microtubule-associated tumor suppressor candidate 2 isoform X1 [Anguilla anguilla]XP_035240987.1 microtubule-associated tumor suppressor candidate 2 isoform X1 [Anguilla anguilla]
MSSQGQPGGPVHPGCHDNQGEIKNNNKQSLCVPEVDADTNANEIQDVGGTGDVGAPPPLVSQSEEQDKVIIWGTDSQCDDPDLEEFEMLECQELEAYLVEEEEEEEEEYGRGAESVSGGGRFLDERPMPHSSAPTMAMTTNKDESYEDVGREVRRGGQDPESTVSLSAKSQERAARLTKAEFSSENDVFVSCLSTMSSLGGSLASALDSTGRAKMADPCPAPSAPSRTISEDFTLASQSVPNVSVRCSVLQDNEGPLGNSGRSASQSSSIDVNLNSAVLPRELGSSEARSGQVEPRMRRSPSLDGLGSLTNGAGKCQSHAERSDHKGYPQMTAEDHEEVHKRGEETQGGLGNKPHPCPPDTVRPMASSESVRPNVETQGSRASPTPGVGSQKPGPKTSGKPSQDTETPDVNSNPVKADPRGGPGEPRPLRKQGSFEQGRSSSPSSLEKRNQLARKPWGSPTRAVTPPSPKTSGSPRRRGPSSPAKTATATRTPHPECPDVPQGGSGVSKSLGKVCPSSGIPKPILQHPPKPTDKVEPDNRSTRSPPPHYPPKPKNVRPKIITYIRKSPQVKPHAPDAPYEIATLPSRLSPYPSPMASKDPKTGGHHPKAAPALSAANLLYDKYRQEMQKACYYAPALMVSGIKAHSHAVPHNLSGKSESFYGELTDKYLQEMGRGGAVALGVPGRDDPTGPPMGPHEAAGLFRSPRVLRPQLGLGAVTRLPSAKNRMLVTGQRSAMTFSHPTPMASPPLQCYQDPSDQGRMGSETGPRSILPKPGQSGLRPPGYSRLPAARLAAFGFVRSASVSSVSSNQSHDSGHSDPCRPTQRPSSGSEDVPLQRASVPPSEGSRGPSTPATTRRSLLPPPRGSPVAARKEMQKDPEASRSASSSPKRFAVVSPKPQSPVHTRQKPAAAAGVAVRGGGGGSPRRDGGQDSERLLVQRLRERCEDQARQLQSLQAELRKATLGLEVFAITTQHFCQKSEAAVVKERELSLELSRIRDEVAFNVSRWERLQREKEDLERRFEQELRRLQEQQEAELGALEERLRARQRAERERLRAQQRAEMEELRTQQQEQMEEMNQNHDAAMVEMENHHSVTIATLQEEHAKTVRDLISAHEQQRRALEEDFEKLRLSLQDQVDTLTFQNRSLRDRAKRFEEALRRSTDEQIVDALAPYQHVEEDLKSLKEVVQMKNQQIHEQEIKITELEKMAQKNVVLEERVQVLQQQNEDLKARIDRNLAMSRQLSEENANLQEHVEKESSEKKRLSRTNEELLWRLQTGELSPRMSPSASPIHRASPGPASPSRLQPFPR